MSQLPLWITEAVEKGGDLKDCLAAWREVKNVEREDRAEQRETERRNKEHEIRLREIEIREKELGLREKGIATGTEGTVNKLTHSQEQVKFPKFVEGQDIEVFLRSFEKLATTYAWDRSVWAVNLIPLLSGKALEAYARLDETHSSNYDEIKDAILRRYELTSDTYRQKFRSSNQSSQESFREFKVRVESLLKHWCNREKADDFESLLDLILREQLINSCSPDLKVWIKERAPVNTKALVEIAEVYQTAHKDISTKLTVGKSQYWSRDRGIVGDNQNKSAHNFREKKCYYCDKPGHMIQDCLKRKKDMQSRSLSDKSYLHKQNRSAICSETTNTAKDIDVDNRLQVNEEIPGLLLERGYVNGVSVNILRDTGSTTTYVKSELVDGECRTGNERNIVLADGTRRTCHEVVVSVETPYIKGKVIALELEDPIAELIIGNRVSYAVDSNIKQEHCDAVETRSQKHCDTVETRSQMQVNKSDENEGETQKITVANLMRNNVLGTRESLIADQMKDTTLAKVRSFAVSEEPENNPVYFTYKSEILYRVFKSKVGNRIYQIVLPENLRNTVLDMAHNIPLAGHLGNKKTRERILQNFFWPGIFIDVARYCRSCPECQRSTSKTKVPKVPLVSIPPMDEPFRRVAIDIVGPLPMTEQKNRYILVVCDYATRFPEAVPLKVQTAESVADALIQIFTRVGLPQEILSDQGSNFMSKMMVELCKLLQIKKLASSPYHPETNGLTERFNGTLKGMLKCYAQQEPQKWDKQLPFLLFAYREVPQETTGFSPFELLYGRHVRGPLTLMKESFEEIDNSSHEQSVLDYIVETRNSLEKVRKMVKNNEMISKKRQKKYFDRNTKTRLLKIGEKALILLPTSTNKLLAQWKGPFLVTGKSSPVDYKIQIRKGVEKTYHINMLKAWHDRKPQNNTTEDIVSCLEVLAMVQDIEVEGLVKEPEINPLLQRQQYSKDVTLNDDLKADQMEELVSLCQKYEDVFTDTPGRTTYIQHHVTVVEGSEPVYSKPYPLPYALREQVQKEIDNLLEAGLIEESDSPYAAPICLQKKGDNTLRFCVDYRKLNNQTIFDPRPMPQMSDVMNKLGKAKYISTLDLTKGYWQIPLDEESKSKSAFVTPMGQFHFTVTPFGMVNSGATFVRLVGMVLSSCKQFADSYMDDIIIHSDNWQDHLIHIESVLQELRRACLTAKPSKCKLGFQKLEFLAHIVGNGEIRISHSRIEAMMNTNRPRTKRQVRQLLGKIGFFRRFIPNFAELTACLTDLVKKEKPARIVWQEEHENAFRSLFVALTQEPVLKNPDFSLMFILQTDASQHAIGAVLLQQFKDGRHPIMYLSKKMSVQEQSYAVVEQECLAIVWSVQKMEEYLYGVEFIVECDHCPLQWLNSAKLNNKRLLRWSLVLQEFRFTVKHIPGRENVMADMLSREVLD